MKLPNLNLPNYEFNVKTNKGKLSIYDINRKKFVVLTPEEWVRQNMVQYLIIELRYPASLIKIEGSLRFNNRIKRSDIVVYNRNGNPFLIVECKSYKTKITQLTFDQVAVYNQSIMAEFILVTNGMQHFCCHMDFEKNKIEFVDEIPKFT